MVAPAGSVVSDHHSAAALWGGTAPDSGDLHLSMPMGNRQKTRGIRSHRRSAVPAPATRRGLPVTSPEQTFIDLAASCDLVQLVTLGDSLVRSKATTPGRLVEACKQSPTRHAALARRAASLVRNKVDSPMESRLRLLMVLRGLPEPRVNFEICDEHGQVRYRLDLSFPDQLLAIEFDARQHVEVRAQWEGDVIRREDVEADGWRFVVVTSTQFYGSAGRRAGPDRRCHAGPWGAARRVGFVANGDATSSAPTTSPENVGLSPEPFWESRPLGPDS